jgi:lipopolysaccharide export system protein LptC
MAIQTQIQLAPARFRGLGHAGDRAMAFRYAKRHSALVKLLRWIFPAMAVCITGLYFLPLRLSVAIPGGGEASVESIDITDGGLKIVNPRIKGVHERHGVYDIRADHAVQQVQDPDMITLNTVSAEVTSKIGETTTLAAPSGLFHSKKEELTFDNGVTIGGSAGFSGQLQTATAFFQSNKLISTDPVDLAFRNSTIKARSMTFYSSESRAVFEGGVRVHLERRRGDTSK